MKSLRILACLSVAFAGVLQGQEAKPAPAAKAPSVDSIYSAKTEAEAIAAARKFVLGPWSYTGDGLKTGAGSEWFKWDFKEDGTMLFQSAYTSEGKWRAAEKRKWKIAQARLKESKKIVYIVELEPAPSGSIIIHPDGKFEWAFEVDLVFQRGAPAANFPK
jgi:hypothetical protein